MTLQLEFIARRRIPWLGIVCLLLSLGVLGVLLDEWFSLKQLASEQVARTARLEQSLQERRRAAEQLQAKSDPETQRRAKEQEKILATLRYPWGRVLSTIEQADGNDVAVLSLSHEQASGLTQLSLEALDTGALVRFVDALNEGAAEGEEQKIAHWYLASYQWQSQNNPPTVKGVVLSK